MHLSRRLTKFVLDAVDDALSLLELFLVVFEARLCLLQMLEEEVAE